VKKRATAVVAIAAAVPVKANAHHTGHVRGCATRACDSRIGARWARRHPKAHAASIIAPYRAWLNRVAWCESSNNTRAVSPNGLYRGLFQFDLPTWRSVGGTGDPIDASRGEQELRAVLLLKRRGTSPWPVCGTA
jgi:transglycosylase-like protein